MSTDDATLLIDIGNTRLKWCALTAADGSPNAVQAIVHADSGFQNALRALLQAHPWQSIWIASVGPAEILARVEESCLQLRAGVPVQHARSLARCGDLRSGYTNPSQLGIDRFLALLGARARWPRKRMLLASIGSAVTIDLLEGDGRHAGGLIAPSPAAMRQSLAALATQLALAEVAVPGGFARDTAGGIASGCMGAVTGLIEQCARAASSTGDPPLLVLSGGGAAEVAPHIALHSHVLPYLVLMGLGHYARLQPAGAFHSADR